MYNNPVYKIFFFAGGRDTIMNEIITTIPRYDKNQYVIVDNEEKKLIDYLKKLRTEKKITKKKISNLIKHNDYWYSQVERDGKNGDDNRQKTIYRNDLIDIICILYYDSTTSDEIIQNRSKSEIYIDKILKADILQGSTKPVLNSNIYRCRTPQEQNKLFDSLQNSLIKLLHDIFNSCSSDKRDRFLNTLKNVNSCLKIDSDFLLYILELPFADFLYEASENQIISLLSDLSKIIDDSNISDLSANEYKEMILTKIKEHIGKDYTVNDIRKTAILSTDLIK